jgi:hypothetical protein
MYANYEYGKGSMPDANNEYGKGQCLNMYYAHYIHIQSPFTIFCITIIDTIEGSAP